VKTTKAKVNFKFMSAVMNFTAQMAVLLPYFYKPPANNSVKKRHFKRSKAKYGSERCVF